MIQRELPLTRVRCCTVYVVSMLHPVPACDNCGVTPSWDEGPISWLLDFED
jgi:hypothetical protein